MTPPAKAKAKKPPTPTEYVVLAKVEVRPTTKITDVFDVPEGVNPNEFTAALWRPIGTITAKGKGEAIKIISGDVEGTFKAVPLSSWKGGVTQAQTTMLKREAID